MSLYTLKELNSKPADIIRSLILEGYKIVPIEPISEGYKIKGCKLIPVEQFNKREFVAVLTNDYYTVKIITRRSYDHFVIIFTAKNKTDRQFDLEESRVYYKSYSDSYNEVYADSEKEAEHERNKYLTKCYEDMYFVGNFPKIYKEIIKGAGQ